MTKWKIYECSKLFQVTNPTFSWNDWVELQEPKHSPCTRIQTHYLLNMEWYTSNRIFNRPEIQTRNVKDQLFYDSS